MRNVYTMTSEFVGRISVAVWTGKLTDDAAREALEAFAAACENYGEWRSGSVHDAVLAEYHHRREGQELCS